MTRLFGTFGTGGKSIKSSCDQGQAKTSGGAVYLYSVKSWGQEPRTFLT